MRVFPISILFAGLGLVPSAVSQVPTGEVLPPCESEAEASARAPQPEAVELADCLAAVYSTATADAAAARVAQLVGKLAEQGGEETFWGRMHMAYADCYGSEKLRLALQPLLPPADTAAKPGFRESLVVLHDIWQTLEDIRAKLDGVTDKATADAAAESVGLFATHIDDCLQQGDKLPAPQGNRIDLVIYYFSGEYRRTAAVYRAWGELQNRSGDYYGSDDLASAMEKLGGTMENIDLSADPYAIGKMLPVCARMEELMCRWLAIAAGVHDAATADAAAPALGACAELLKAAAAGLGQGYEKDLGHVSPRFLFLSLACDRVAQSFARHACFGSDALRGALEF